MMEQALTAAIEMDHMVQHTFMADRHRTKFIRTTPESDKVGNNFRMARTIQETVRNGKLSHEARTNTELFAFSFWRPGVY